MFTLLSFHVDWITHGGQWKESKTCWFAAEARLPFRNVIDCINGYAIWTGLAGAAMKSWCRGTHRNDTSHRQQRELPEGRGTHSILLNRTMCLSIRQRMSLYCFVKCSATSKGSFIACVIIYAPTTTIWVLDALIPEAVPSH